MPIVKLNTHQRNHYPDDIVYCQKDLPDVKPGDVVEIFSPEENFSRLLLQIPKTADRLKSNHNNPTISIEQSIAMMFQLRNFNDVILNVVDPDTVLLDSVELVFKDQYLSRSDMWRLKKHITNTCVYLNKKIEFSHIRCQVFEMLSQGCRMASGYINEETKVVFRSASSMVYLFLQMSSEMWDYDINGDLYFEKAVKGFLSDLFNKWKTFNCSHDVTIVLFSRTFYQANDINCFPEAMQECLQQDYKGRFYEDYYRVAVQNERFDDWTPTLILLRKLFNQYEDEVIRYHEKRGLKVPKAYNSTASQGNFLEVLNMSLNVFERHNLDRSFDRTGQLSVVITPGVGVYQVDLDLTNITKQRIIDNGIGSDLVCLGEQPLHAVPLFKFNSRHSNMSNDEYNMPHWINLSFYSSRQRFSPSPNFIPRIKMPNVLPNNNNDDGQDGGGDSPSRQNNLNLPAFTGTGNNKIHNNDSGTANSLELTSCQNFLDQYYEEYDNRVFRTSLSNKHLFQPAKSKASSVAQIEEIPDVSIGDDPVLNEKPKRRLSVLVAASSRSGSGGHDGTRISPSHSPQSNDTIDGIPVQHHNYHHHDKSMFSLSTSVENRFSSDNSFKIKSKDDIVVHKFKGQHRTKALINPFDPAHVTIKLTSNRRRWAHVFPLGPTGIFMQQHHYQAIPQRKSKDFNIVYDSNEMLAKEKTGSNSSGSGLKRTGTGGYDQIDAGGGGRISEKDQKIQKSFLDNNSLDKKNSLNQQQQDITDLHQKQRSVLLTDSSLLWAWGATGEQEWTPAITTGVDWKSLVTPACLPITTDFLPDKRTLQQDYVTYVYDLLPEEQASELAGQQRYQKSEEKKNSTILTNDQFYNELISQRLQQGFQIILLPKSEKHYTFTDRTGNKFTYILSIGRIYHELAHKGNKISIIYYHPRHPYKANNIRYCYRIRTPDNETYGVSWVDFTSEKLETYKWNYLDNYICLKGDYTEYPLVESLKYWRFRLLVLPTQYSKTKKIIDKYQSGDDEFRSDIYEIFPLEEKIQLQKGFIKLLKVINGIKSPPVNKTSANNNATNKSATTNVVDVPGKNLIRRNSSSSIMDSTGQDEMKARHENLRSVFNRSADSTSTTTAPALETISEKCPNVSGMAIIEMMEKCSDLFPIKLKSLPEYTFISLEAIEWAIANVDQIQDETMAENIFSRLQSQDIIRHASGDVKQPFKRGFYLYCIMTKQNRQFFERNEIERKYFERSWMEVGVVQQHTKDGFDDLHNLHVQTSEFTFKNFTCELENRTDRVEWINVKYHSLYDPEQAFEMIIEWMVATGNAIPEIVLSWCRTKGTNLHIVPIPWDPFALPFSNKSDPLRGPIYIALNIDSLCHARLLEEGGERLFNFQEKILQKFGFIPFHDPSTENQRQFVHVSGSIFVMIPSKNAITSPSKNLNKRGRFLKTSSEQEMACSPHEEYITRHFSGMQQQRNPEAHIDAKIGFLWCWNYMITKRWKTPVTGDENSMRKIMKDFRRFCSNSDDRLQEFWRQYQTKIILDDEPNHHHQFEFR